MNSKLPVGYTLDEKGRFVHELSEIEVKEMIKTDNIIFILSVLKVLQAILIFILVYAHLCNH